MKGLITGGVVGGLIAAVMITTMGSGGGVAITGTGADTDPAATPASTACAAPVPNLTAQQTAIARVGIAAADRAKVGDAGAVIIIATGLVESDLADLDHGDRDSIGWLQQRPSQGWGNADDPAKAADDFFAALKRLPWQQMRPGDAAQAVQRSAHPERYGQRIGQATAIVAAARGAKCGTVQQQVSAGSCPATGNPAERGLQPGTLRAMRCGAAQFPFVTRFAGRGGRPNASDHPNGRAVDFMIPAWSSPGGNARGWEVARWFEQHADQLGVTYLIWDDKIWRARSRKWEAYTHPNGATSNPTLRHLDHVHVSTK